MTCNVCHTHIEQKWASPVTTLHIFFTALVAALALLNMCPDVLGSCVEVFVRKGSNSCPSCPSYGAWTVVTCVIQRIYCWRNCNLILQYVSNHSFSFETFFIVTQRNQNLMLHCVFNLVTQIFFFLYLCTTLIIYFGEIVNMISIHVPHKNK